jgi:hypothetical protein
VVTASRGIAAMLKSAGRFLKRWYEVCIMLIGFSASVIAEITGGAALKVGILFTQVTLGGMAASMAYDRMTRQENKTALQDLTALLQACSSQILFPSQDEPYRRLQEYVKANRVTEAVFIQYSGEQCKNLVSTILAAGAKVELYTEGARSTRVTQERCPATTGPPSSCGAGLPNTRA